MTSPLEIAANLFYAVSVWLAGRNNVHTWWIGIVGSALFAAVFFFNQLYADVTLQAFFIGTSLWGWWNWKRDRNGVELPVRATRWTVLAALAAAGAAVMLGYGWLLHRFTDAYSPFPDALVLAFSVVAQFLLMGRRVENWPCWLIVNTVAVPLYASRGLHLTAALYVAFWINALVAWRGWRRLVAATPAAATP